MGAAWRRAQRRIAASLRLRVHQTSTGAGLSEHLNCGSAALGPVRDRSHSRVHGHPCAAPCTGDRFGVCSETAQRSHASPGSRSDAGCGCDVEPEGASPTVRLSSEPRLPQARATAPWIGTQSSPRAAGRCGRSTRGSRWVPLSMTQRSHSSAGGAASAGGESFRSDVAARIAIHLLAQRAIPDCVFHPS